MNGFAEGEGTARGVAEYRGGFQGGRKHGKGVKTWPNGDRYEGEFVADLKAGYGVYVWGSGPWEGERYDGSFAADRRHGYGIYWWPSGDIYSGPWESDLPTGPGTEMMRARAKFAAEAQAAVAREGQKVCREMPVDRRPGLGARGGGRHRRRPCCGAHRRPRPGRPFPARRGGLGRRVVMDSVLVRPIKYAQGEVSWGPRGTLS